MLSQSESAAKVAANTQIIQVSKAELASAQPALKEAQARSEEHQDKYNRLYGRVEYSDGAVMPVILLTFLLGLLIGWLLYKYFPELGPLIDEKMAQIAGYDTKSVRIIIYIIYHALLLLLPMLASGIIWGIVKSIMAKGNFNLWKMTHPIAVARYKRAYKEQEELDANAEALEERCNHLNKAVKDAEAGIAACRRNDQAAAACERARALTDKFPEGATDAFCLFVQAYELVNETDPRFFELKSRMEAADGQTLFTYSMGLNERNVAPMQAIRFLQLSANKNFEPAKTMLGVVFSSISNAVGKGDYETAYVILGALIEAGNMQALSVKMQLDSDVRAAEAARRAEEAAADAAFRAEINDSVYRNQVQSALGDIAKQQEYLLRETMMQRRNW